MANEQRNPLEDKQVRGSLAITAKGGAVIRWSRVRAPPAYDRPSQRTSSPQLDPLTSAYRDTLTVPPLPSQSPPYRNRLVINVFRLYERRRVIFDAEHRSLTTRRGHGSVSTPCNHHSVGGVNHGSHIAGHRRSAARPPLASVRAGRRVCD